MKKELRVIISGGGTGGHIFPALSIANEIRRRDPAAKILFVGAIGKMEMERVPAAGYQITGLPIAGLKRGLSADNLRLPFKILKSLHIAKRVLKEFKPSVVVGVGGYASAPLLWMAGRAKVPYLIQEQNSYAGLANRLLAPKASVICTAYPDMKRFFPKNKIIVTGNPVRAEICEVTPELKAKSKEHFGISADKKVLLVIGGSLGARSINNALKSWLTNNNTPPFHIIWQTGKIYYTDIEKFTKTYHPTNLTLTAFIERMEMAIAAADVIISRAGAGTISELAIAGKATVFVPSPIVAEDHQTHNASVLANMDAAYMISDSDVSDKLMEKAITLINDSEKIARLESAIKKMAYHNSAGLIVDELYKLINKS